MIRRAYPLWQENPIYSARVDLVLGERPHQHSPIYWPAWVVRHGWEMAFRPRLYARQ